MQPDKSENNKLFGINYGFKYKSSFIHRSLAPDE